jgi:predicted dehydrogenase
VNTEKDRETHFKTSNAPIRIGMVGIGNWAKHGHVRVLKLLPQYGLSAIYSQRRAAAEEAVARYGFKHVVNSLDELVNHPEVDLVVVLTTAPQHAEAARAAIAAKKDVYCEWPLTPSIETSEELVRLADVAGVRTMLGVQRRFAPHNRYLADLLKDGYVGKLRSVRMYVGINYFQAQLSKILRWTVPPENFSSMVAIYGGHFLDMLFQAIGWPNSVSALAVNQFPEITIIETGEKIKTTNADEFVLTGTLPEGAIVTTHFEGGKRNGFGVQIDIAGTEGDIRITNNSAFGEVGDDYVMTGARGNNLKLEPLPIPAVYNQLPESGLPSAVLELAHNYAVFAKDRAAGTQFAPTFRDAVRLQKLIATAVESSDTGRRMAFNADMSR